MVPPHPSRRNPQNVLGLGDALGDQDAPNDHARRGRYKTS